MHTSIFVKSLLNDVNDWVRSSVYGIACEMDS